MGADLVYGVQARGDVFVNKSKVALTYLKIAATTLNLAEHACRGAKDISPSSTSGSSELKIYKGLKDEFYLKDFWLSFPPEVIHHTLYPIHHTLYPIHHTLYNTHIHYTLYTIHHT
jgi:hypothetical protein